MADRTIEELEKELEDLRAQATSTQLTPKVNKRGRKSTKVEAARNRREVVRLRLRGLSLDEIANKMNLSTSMITKYIEQSRKEAKDAFSGFEKDQFASDAKQVYDMLYEKALYEYENADNPAHRLKALDFIRILQTNRMEVAKDVGLVIPPLPDQNVKHEHSISYNLPPWDEKVMHEVAVALLQRQFTPLLEPTPDIVDAELVPNDSPNNIDDSPDPINKDENK